MPRRFACSTLVCLALTVGGLFLCQAAAPAQPAPTVVPRTATLKGQAIPLGTALAELSRQTGIQVRNRRSTRAEPKLNLTLERTSFWQALDTIAGQAAAGVSLYQPDGSIALVDPPANPLPVSHSGIFRSAARRLSVSRDLETGAHSCTVALEIAWEPWFQPFLLEVKSYSATMGANPRGKPVVVSRQGTGQMPVNGRTAVEVELTLPAPDRLVPAMDALKGSFTVIGPTTMHTVRFDHLAAKDAKPVTKTPEDGITVTLKRLTVVDTDRWEAEIALAYPPGGPRFESFQSWLVNNRIFLEKGKRRFTPRPADERILRLTPTQAVIQYYFVEEAGKTPRLGSPGDWDLIYITPGRIVEVPATFAFKDLRLP
jgi:hypothetical protein